MYSDSSLTLRMTGYYIVFALKFGQNHSYERLIYELNIFVSTKR